MAIFRATLRDLSSRALRLVPNARPTDTGALGLLRRPRPRTIAEHHANVIAVGCIVSRLPNPMLHYCHDGSIARIAGSLVTPGDRNEALVLPLAVQYHTGRSGIDGRLGVYEWERMFGTQTAYLDQLCSLLGYDVWDLARAWAPSLLRPPRWRVVDTHPRAGSGDSEI
jgi:hypothetical protein